MNEIKVPMMPTFKRAYKKLHHNQKKIVNDAVSEIVCNPAIGTEKKGDLAGVFVHKFDCAGQLMLLAYEYDPATRFLLAIGIHENFNRDLKRVL